MDTLYSSRRHSLRYRSNQSITGPVAALMMVGCVAPVALAGPADTIFADGFEPPEPLVEVMDLSMAEGDAGVSLFNLTVALSNASPEVVTFDYATADGSAQAGSDYTAASGQGQIDPGDTELLIPVEINGDICLEDSEIFELSISNLSANARPGRLLAQVTISNDDPLPLLEVTAADALMEGDAGSQNFNFTLRLDRVSCTDVQVDYATADVTASVGDDYNLAQGTATLAALSTTAEISVPVLGDICVESDEQFDLTLNNLTPNAGFAAASPSARGTIANDDPLPILDLAPVAENEGDAGTTPLSFGLTLDRVSCSDTTVDFITSDLSATTADNDYLAQAASVVIPAFTSTGAIEILGLGDGDVEPTEQFQLTLLGAAPDVALGISNATGTLINDDFISSPGVSALNDTGVTRCSNDVADDLNCNDIAAGTDQFPNQDAEVGRDVNNNFDDDGVAGFQFTKLDAGGVPLADQSASFDVSPWSCVRDEVTGLTWETKTDNGDLHTTTNSYTWFNGTGFGDGGFAGISDGGQCTAPGECDSGAFIAAVNTEALCGITRWRLPTRTELMGLVDYASDNRALIDDRFFPNTLSTLYWTSEPVLSANGVRVVDFSRGTTDANGQGDQLYIRLVAGEQP